MPTIHGMAKVKEGIVLGGISGRAGNAVFAQTPNGTVLRERPLVNDPRSPRQQANRQNLARIGDAWRNLTLAQAESWADYANREAGSSSSNRARPNLIFTALSLKFLQMNPGAELPLDPPDSPFMGDAVRFSVSAVGGSVELTPDRSNSDGVVTEVLLQPLLSAHRRTYLSRYRSAGFVTFKGGVPEQFGVDSRFCAVAVRFVCAPTGQSTALVELGKFGV